MEEELSKVLDTAEGNFEAAQARLFDLLRIESVSTDPAFDGQCRKAADWLVSELTGLGFEASLRETPGKPMVVAHYGARNGAAPHALFYGHYDVQPPDPLDLWQTPPFEPRLNTRADGAKEIVARGASDDKGQLMTFVEACRAWIEAEGRLPMPITILFEGEEETGSPSLAPFLEANVEELRADVALVCDTGMWNPQTPAITTMLRGMLAEEVIVHGPSRDLHSGLYGGPSRNPIRVLTHILGQLYDEEGRVTVPGFYDGVEELDPALRGQWQALDFAPEKFLGEVGLSVPAGEAGRSVLEQLWARPTAEVNGIVGGYTGTGTKTVIPAKASAKLSFRLVGKQDPHAIQAAFRDFVRSRLPEDCKAEFICHGANPALTLPTDSLYLQKARAALREEFGRDAAMVGSGGSIPIVGAFKEKLGMDALMVGFALDDDRIHSPNEKYDLASFQHGIRSWARILGALGDAG